MDHQGRRIVLSNFATRIQCQLHGNLGEHVPKNRKSCRKAKYTPYISVWVMVDISDHNINRFLHGPTFISLVTSPCFYHKMTAWANQHPGLTQVIAKKDPEWYNNISA